MFADIILHRRLPGRFETFTYRVPQGAALSVGQFVEVPFGKRSVPGIIWKLHKNPPAFETKEISMVRDITLPPLQQALAQWMSIKFNCSIGKVVDFFVAEKIWTSEQEKVPHVPRPAVKSGSSFGMTGLKCIWEKTALHREKFYKEAIAKVPPGKQLLILFPERFFAEKCAPKGAALFHGELSEKEKAALWEGVYAGTINLIAGTRAALFLPFQNLHSIILDFEENENYHEKRAPYYDAQNVALKLAQLTGASFTIISAAPRVETYHALKKMNAPMEVNDVAAERTKVQLLDMKNERIRGNYGIFAAAAVEKIAAALAQQKQILLFINRRGRASAVICTDCHEVVRCPQCRAPLTLHEDDQLICHRDKKTLPLMSHCTHCGSVNLKPIGFGTESLEKEIKKIFGKAKVVRLDKETMKSKKNLWESFLDPRLGEDHTVDADIIVATQIIEKPLTIPRLTLAVAVNPDPLLNLPDFRASHRLFSLLTHIGQLTNGGELLVQTFLCDHSLFSHLEKNTSEAFYEEELLIRKILHLPPFSTVSL